VASFAGARPGECSALLNKRCALEHTPKFESSWGRCPQSAALPRAIPAARFAGAWPGALAIADSRMVAIVKYTIKILKSQVGVAAPTPSLSAALGLSCRRLEMYVH
jgi:hypothetical protein